MTAQFWLGFAAGIVCFWLLIILAVQIWAAWWDWRRKLIQRDGPQSKDETD